MRVLIGFLIALAGAVTQTAVPGEADEILAQLSKIRLDKKQIHSIRDVTIRRDALSISFTRGTVSFLEPVMGKVTGAVFLGAGEIVAIPPDAIEKQQIYKFTGSPILNEPFRAAIFRFTDDTYEEITTEIAQHAHEDVSEEDSAQFGPWEQAVRERSSLLNFRILADLMESAKRPLFFAELDGDHTGRFNVVLDPQATEEVAVFSAADLWSNFHQRSEARNPEAVAHERKVPFDVLSYDIDAAISADNRADLKTDVRLKLVADGQRVLTFQLSQDLRLSAVSLDTGEVVAFNQHATANVAIAVLPRPLNAGQEITLRFAYSGNWGDRRSWYPNPGFDDRAVFNLTFHYPAAFALLATGSKVKEWDENALRHSSWKSDGESSIAGFTVASPPAVASEAPVSYFTGLLGPYPYSTLNVLDSPQNVSHNWPALIELSNRSSTKTEWIAAQEIARQWFGHKIAPASYHDEWLFEGLPRYLGAMYIESKYADTPQFREILNEARAASIDNDSAGPIWLGPRLTNTVSPGGYRAVPNKGIWVLHMLRMLMRRDGTDRDATFFGMLRELVETYRDKSVSTWDFKRLIEKHAGMDMDWFFDEWVFATGIPAYSLDYRVEPAQNGFVIHGNITQSGAPDGFTMPVPVYADDELLGRVKVDEEAVEFRFSVTKKPERVVLDPFETVLRK